MGTPENEGPVTYVRQRARDAAAIGDWWELVLTREYPAAVLVGTYVTGGVESNSPPRVSETSPAEYGEKCAPPAAIG